MNTGPALVSILRQGSFLVASVHTALDDTQLVRFQQDLVADIGRYRARGVVIDVAALDVIDSFATRTLRDIAEMARLRGAATVIVGIQPDVAFAMVRLGLGTGTALPPSTSRRASRCSLRCSTTATGFHERAGACSGHLPRPDRRSAEGLRSHLPALLPRSDEVALAAAYELGRRALAEEVSVLDLVRVHHDVLIDVLAKTRADEAVAVIESAADFLAEAMGSHDMAQRRVHDSPGRQPDTVPPPGSQRRVR